MEEKDNFEDIKLIGILWDYMSMNHELKHSDCIRKRSSKPRHIFRKRINKSIYNKDGDIIANYKF